MTISEALDLLSRETHVEKLDDMVPRFLLSRVSLPNGWSVSVGYGPTHYCVGGPDSPDCEIAVFDADHHWVYHPGEDQVFGHVPAETLLRVVDAVSQAHRTELCPCPDCVGSQVCRVCRGRGKIFSEHYMELRPCDACHAAD